MNRKRLLIETVIFVLLALFLAVQSGRSDTPPAGVLKRNGFGRYHMPMKHDKQYDRIHRLPLFKQRHFHHLFHRA